MKIVFHCATPLPVKTYGGIERIVFWHMVELSRLGHKVVLIGHPDSDVKKFGIEHIPYANADLDWERLIPLDTDIAHLSYNHQVRSGLPTLCTVHGNGQLGERFLPNSVFVSKRHAQIHGAKEFVHNALDFSEYPFNEDKEINWNRFLFLAKGSWRVKNLRHCIRACRRTKKHLEIIGGRSLFPWPRIKSHGFVGGKEKLSIMENCDALLFPVRWEEPFGIAIIEAMAMGLPVIGSPYGSLPELVTEELGIICKNFEELVMYLSTDNSKKFNPRKIRETAKERFSIEKHSKAYLEYYEKILSGQELHSTAPKLIGQKRAESLLDF
ncbi:MAG: hypothetical protein CME70_03530 [Halobacteriovorax sp.]|nr:hypothetical protein [Halobacteriovorax sp.]